MRFTLSAANEAAQSPEFRHQWAQETDRTLADKVDRLIGGWPADATQLVMRHNDERDMYFTHGQPNDGWNTTVLTRQRYYAARVGFEERDISNAQVYAKHAAQDLAHLIEILQKARQ